MFRHCKACGEFFPFNKLICPKCCKSARPLTIGVAGIFAILKGLVGVAVAIPLLTTDDVPLQAKFLAWAVLAFSAILVRVSLRVLKGQQDARVTLIALLVLLFLGDLYAGAKLNLPVPMVAETAVVLDIALIVLLALPASQAFCIPIPAKADGTPAADEGPKPGSQVQ